MGFLWEPTGWHPCWGGCTAALWTVAGLAWWELWPASLSSYTCPKVILCHGSWDWSPQVWPEMRCGAAAQKCGLLPVELRAHVWLPPPTFLPPPSRLQGSVSLLAARVPAGRFAPRRGGKMKLCLPSVTTVSRRPCVGSLEVCFLCSCAASAASSARTNVAGHELIFMTLHTAARGSTAVSCRQLCGLSSFSGEVIVVNRHVLHIYGFVLVFLMREEHYTLHQ